MIENYFWQIGRIGSKLFLEKSFSLFYFNAAAVLLAN